jgi:hypothetical protein
MFNVIVVFQAQQVETDAGLFYRFQGVALPKSIKVRLFFPPSWLKMN